MVTLTAAINRMAEGQPLEIWAVLTAYREDPDSSDMKLFSSYSLAKKYFTRIVPEEERIERSETVRIDAEEQSGNSDIVRHNRQYYLDNDYYENWCVDEWSDDTVMSYYCCVQKIKVNET